MAKSDDIPYDGSQIGFRVAPNELRSRVHPLVKKTAREFAGEFYEFNRSPVFRQTFRRQMDYVDVCWPNYVQQARDILLDMLQKPGVTDHIKNEIYDAVTNNFEERTKNSIKGVH